MNKRNIFLFFILAAGLILRVYRLGANDLWHDEALSFVYSGNFNLNFIFHHDLHPPLYYLVLHYWVTLFGSSEFMLRLPSVIFSTLAIPVVYKIGKTVFNYKIGLLAALIFSLSPFQLWYAQEARPYALSVFLVSIATLFLSRVVYEDKRHVWKYFIATSILCVFTEYVNLLILLSFTPAVCSKKNLVKRWIIGWTVTFLIFSPLLYLLWTRMIAFINGRFWLEKPTGLYVIETLKRFMLGYESRIKASGIILIFFTILGFFKLSKHKSKLVFITAPFFITLAIVFLLSVYLPCSLYLDRQLISISIFYYLLIAGALWMIDKKEIRALPLLLLVIFFVFSIKDYYSIAQPDSKKPFKPLAEFIANNKKTGDVILFGTEIMTAPLGDYYLKDMDRYFFNAQNSTIKKYNNYFDRVAGTFEYPERQAIKRIWLLTGCWKRDGSKDLGSESARRWLSDYGLFSERREFNGIFVDLCTLNNQGKL